MILGKELVEDGFTNNAVRRVFVALSPLVPHHVLLIRKIGLIEIVGQIAHAVGFQPEGEFQLIGRKCFVVVGAVEIGCAVDVRGSGGFKVVEVRAARDMLGTFEHHMFEEMRKAGAARGFVHRADVIPEIDGNERKAMVLGKDDFKPIRELVALKFDLRYLKRREFLIQRLRLKRRPGSKNHN